MFRCGSKWSHSLLLKIPMISLSFSIHPLYIKSGVFSYRCNSSTYSLIWSSFELTRFNTCMMISTRVLQRWRMHLKLSLPRKSCSIDRARIIYSLSKARKVCETQFWVWVHLSIQLFIFITTYLIELFWFRFIPLAPDVHDYFFRRFLTLDSWCFGIFWISAIHQSLATTDFIELENVGDRWMTIFVTAKN